MEGGDNALHSRIIGTKIVPSRVRKRLRNAAVFAGVLFLQRYDKRAMSNLFGHCRAGVSSAKPKIRKVECRSKRRLDYAETKYLRRQPKYEKVERRSKRRLDYAEQGVSVPLAEMAASVCEGLGPRGAEALCVQAFPCFSS